MALLQRVAQHNIHYNGQQYNHSCIDKYHSNKYILNHVINLHILHLNRPADHHVPLDNHEHINHIHHYLDDQLIHNLNGHNHRACGAAARKKADARA